MEHTYKNTIKSLRTFTQFLWVRDLEWAHPPAHSLSQQIQSFWTSGHFRRKQCWAIFLCKKISKPLIISGCLQKFFAETKCSKSECSLKIKHSATNLCTKFRTKGAASSWSVLHQAFPGPIRVRDEFFCGQFKHMQREIPRPVIKLEVGLVFPSQMMRETSSNHNFLFHFLFFFFCQSQGWKPPQFYNSILWGKGGGLQRSL